MRERRLRLLSDEERRLLERERWNEINRPPRHQNLLHQDEFVERGDRVINDAIRRAREEGRGVRGQRFIDDGDPVLARRWRGL